VSDEGNPLLGSVGKFTPGFGRVIVILSVLLWAGCLAVGPAIAQDQANESGRPFPPPAVTHQDTLASWGPLPAPSDSVRSLFEDPGRPGWETAVLVPYWIVGIPFRIAYFALDQTVIGLDKLGLFGPAAEYPGIKGPFKSYIMPTIAIGGLEGFTAGINITRPHFLGRNNLLFVKGTTSTRKAYNLSGGTLFHLDGRSDIQFGGGREQIHQTRYYGLGPEAIAGDRSYYHRRTYWAGVELDTDLGRNVGVEFKSYFSRILAKEPQYNVDQSLGRVHADDLPYGYPGESNGWTHRLALIRNNTDQRGRPASGGFQSLGASLFTASDGSGLQFLTYHVNAEKFFKLWHTDRTLAVRGFFNRISNIGNEEIPFTRLVTFQRPDQLRGFKSLRFYGLGSIAGSVEYRWPVWVSRDRDDQGVDAYIFSDIGQVYDRAAEISWHNTQVTGGFGLRLIDSTRDLTARFEVGFSQDGAVVILKFSQTFQYDSKGMLYGKNPTKVY